MHDRRDLRWVRRPAGSRREHVVDFTEVVRRHNAGAGHRQELRVFSPAVVEAMDRTARYAEGLTRANVERPSVDAPSRCAFKPVDRLLEGVMTMRRRHLAV